MKNIFIEENGVYSIDCSNAIWATDKMHEDYHNAEKPDAFHPMADKKISIVTRKFYDSLHYLRLLNKNKPIQYIYILEYPNGDATTRKRLRNRLKVELPFVLQDNIGNGNKLIEQIDVLSIDEWNADSIYGNYPLRRISGDLPI